MLVSPNAGVNAATYGVGIAGVEFVVAIAGVVEPRNDKPATAAIALASFKIFTLVTTAALFPTVPAWMNHGLGKAFRVRRVFTGSMIIELWLLGNPSGE